MLLNASKCSKESIMLNIKLLQVTSVVYFTGNSLIWKTMLFIAYLENKEKLSYFTRLIVY